MRKLRIVFKFCNKKCVYRIVSIGLFNRFILLLFVCSFIAMTVWTNHKKVHNRISIARNFNAGVNYRNNDKKGKSQGSSPGINNMSATSLETISNLHSSGPFAFLNRDVNLTMEDLALGFIGLGIGIDDSSSSTMTGRNQNREIKGMAEIVS